jgi:DNA-binding NarL/FixJ family response regulator
MPTIKLLLVDDNPAILDKLADMLAHYFVVVGRARSGAEVPSQATNLCPDIVILDLSLGDMNGFEVAITLGAMGCPAKVIFFSLHEERALVRRAFEVGAAGYVYKSRSLDIISAIHLVAAGGIFYPVDCGLPHPDAARRVT